MSAHSELVFPRVTPAPPGLPLFRKVHRLFRNPLSSYPEEVYRTSFVQLLPRLVLVCAPELVDFILREARGSFQKDPMQKAVLTPVVGNGVLTADHDLWRWQRRAVAALFRPADTANHVPDITEAVEQLLSEWDDQPPGSILSADVEMIRVAYHVLAQTVLPSDHEQVTQTLLSSVQQYSKGVPWAIAMHALRLPSWLPRPGKLTMRREARTLRQMGAEIVKERRESGDPGDDLLGRLLTATDPDSGRSLSDEQVIDNLMTFLLAGHDTMAKALTWSLYILSLSRFWQSRLSEEVNSIAGDNPITADHLPKLETVTRFLKESMRLFPPAPVIPRIATSDVVLGDKQVKAGTIVLMPTYVIQRHESLWRDPDRFDPNRFTVEGEASMVRCQYMPFGAGPRSCIGGFLAMTAATVVLASLVRSKQFALCGEPPNPLSRILLVPDRPLRLRVTPRPNTER